MTLRVLLGCIKLVSVSKVSNLSKSFLICQYLMRFGFIEGGTWFQLWHRLESPGLGVFLPWHRPKLQIQHWPSLLTCEGSGRKGVSDWAEGGMLASPEGWRNSASALYVCLAEQKHRRVHIATTMRVSIRCTAKHGVRCQAMRRYIMLNNFHTKGYSTQPQHYMTTCTTERQKWTVKMNIWINKYHSANVNHKNALDHEYLRQLDIISSCKW